MASRPDGENDALCLRYLGANGLLLEGGGARVMIDPFFSRPSRLALLRPIAPQPERIRQALASLAIDRLDAILLTHTHYDHALDAPTLAALTGARLAGSETALELGRRAGLPERQLALALVGGAIDVGSLRFRIFPGSHLPFPGPLARWLRLDAPITAAPPRPAWAWEYTAGPVLDLLLEVAGQCIFIQGSAGLPPKGCAALAAGAAVLGIGGLGLVPSAYRQAWFEQVVRRSGATRVYLSHWDDFTQPLAPAPPALPGTRRLLSQLEALAAGLPPICLQLLPVHEPVRMLSRT